MSSVLISPDERDLITDIRGIAFGEVLDVDATRASNLVTVNLSSKEANFIRALREYKKLHKVVIHDGEPTAADIVGVTPSGRQCVKKLRF